MNFISTKNKSKIYLICCHSLTSKKIDGHSLSAAALVAGAPATVVTTALTGEPTATTVLWWEADAATVLSHITRGQHDCSAIT